MMLTEIATIIFLATLPCLNEATPLPRSAAGATPLLRSAGATPLQRPARAACSSGKKSYLNQEIDREVCCYDILCNMGEEPVPCDDRKSFVPSCRSCKEGTFQPARWSLSDKTYNKCRMKKHCDQYLDRGTTYRDATCQCPPDQWLRDDGTCLPRFFCEPGSGQTASGGCERCTEGKTYSDEDSNTAVCKAVTNCESQSKCTLKTATIISDSTCGPKTNDLRLCHIKPTTQVPKRSTLPAIPDHRTTTIQPPPFRHGASPDNTAEVVGGSLGGLLLLTLVVVAAVICHIRRRRHRKEKRYHDLDRHMFIAELICNMSVADDITRLREGVFQIVKNVLAVKAPDQWENLGCILLGDDFNAVRATLKANTSLTESERMQLMLEEWRQPCETTGPDLATLFRAMYSPKNRKILKLVSVYEEIKREYGTRIGLLEDIQLGLSARFRNQAVSQRLSCVKCHDGDDSIIGSSEKLLTRKNKDNINMPSGSPTEARENENPSGSLEEVEDAADPPSVLFDTRSQQPNELHESNV